MVAVAAAVAFVNRELAAGKKEVERFKAERSMFSGQVQAAVARYNMQSMDLERRSTAATSGSASAVVESTMGLRESTQNRSEKWENIGNTILATTLDIAALTSNVINALDEVVGFTQFVANGVDAIRAGLALIGVPIKEIAKNTRKDDSNGTIDILRVGLEQNRKVGPKKPQILPKIK